MWIAILVVLMVFMLLGAPNLGPWNHGWGWGPSGGLGVILIILLVLLLMGRL